MRLLIPAVVVVAFAGCAQTRPSVEIERTVSGADGDRFGVTDSRLALASDDFVSGENTQLTRSNAGARGVLFGHMVDVTWTSTSLAGQVDATPSRLSVQTSENGTTSVRGSLAHLPVQFQLRDDRWSGRVGACRYDLQRIENGFVGTSSCQPFLDAQLVVAFDDDLTLRPLPEQVTYLAIALEASRPGQNYDSEIARFASRNRMTQRYIR